MFYVKLILKACETIMYIPIDLFGYQVTLMQFTVYCFVVFVLMIILYKVLH